MFQYLHGLLVIMQIYAVSITIWIVLGFLLLALIREYDFPPFMVLIIAILNDGTIMTISKDRVKPSPKPDSWKLYEIFATGVVIGTYLALIYCLNHFGVESLSSTEEISSAMYLQVSIISQALIFVTRSQSWSFMERPGILLMCAFVVAQLFSHFAWVQADRKSGRLRDLKYPLISYFTKSISKSYGVLILDQVERGHIEVHDSKAAAAAAAPPPPNPPFLCVCLSLAAASRPIAAMNNRKDPTTTTTGDLDALFKQKRALRSRVRKDLKNMDPTLRSQEDGHSLMGKKLYVPRVEDRNSNMRMFNIASIDDLIANSMNILEPAPIDAEGNEREDVMLANDPVDLFLLPGLAFDKSGRRLGRGGGYYDTLLMKYQELAKERKWKQPLLVALSYTVQIMDEGVIPVTPSDVLIDALVTPSGVIPISPAAMEMCH
ncbi:hypothetical protein TEA_025146 [Camellia sinensis var. sinensis]|uniref:5-formyltetrahydrofolate cyclo-ligase n=2 Tax=Camellia sinensis TaxID=4442 RepID=A0A4S4D5G7_CAMSN|nr:hypothetical protein TEA_025146 [Camellia sinensis var. sinensis]